MKAKHAKMSANGQVVIPIEIREKTGSKPGMRFLVSIDGESIVLKPVRDNISIPATSEIGANANKELG